MTMSLLMYVLVVLHGAHQLFVYAQGTYMLSWSSDDYHGKALIGPDGPWQAVVVKMGAPNNVSSP